MFFKLQKYHILAWSFVPQSSLGLVQSGGGDGTGGMEPLPESVGPPGSVKIEPKPRLLFLLWERKDATCPPYTGTHFIYVSFFFPVIHYEEKAEQDLEWKELGFKCPLYLLYDVDPRPLSSFPAPSVCTTSLRIPGNLWGRYRKELASLGAGSSRPWPSLTATRGRQVPREQGSRREAGGVASFSHLELLQYY